jgi:hypothetical protein
MRGYFNGKPREPFSLQERLQSHKIHSRRGTPQKLLPVSLAAQDVFVLRKQKKERLWGSFFRNILVCVDVMVVTVDHLLERLWRIHLGQCCISRSEGKRSGGWGESGGGMSVPWPQLQSSALAALTPLPALTGFTSSHSETVKVIDLMGLSAMKFD